MKATAILFDLFDTVVRFSDRMPTLATGAGERRSALAWIEDVSARLCPEVAFADLLAAVLAVSQEIARGMPPEYVEVSSRERFRRALERVGIEAGRAGDAAAEISAVHMAHIDSLTYLPEGFGETLATLSRRYRLGLVSNFDDDATARRILERHGVAGYFDSILVSEGFGRRKPHPSIFEASLGELGVTAADAVFVGDSYALDVIGARGVGMRVVQISHKEPDPTWDPQPDARIRELPELLAILG